MAKPIRYSLVESPLGLLLVAATERGVCNVRIGAAAGEVLSGLREEFPFAALERDDAGLATWAAAVAGLAAGRPPAVEVPLDVPASRFRRRVWEALRRIPRGERRTYAELARAIGRPRAARAVGGACAANPVALLIPCHRVVPSAGGVGGYRWGAARKLALLRAEAGRRGPGADPRSEAPPAR
jgi:AraC family transcriptional regulator of adaptative response/methylated-DNA-[protein]-cysteine methyltransferase